LGLAGAADIDLGMAGFAYGATLWPIQANSGPGTALSGNSWARAIDWVRTADSGGRRKVIILEVQTNPALGNYEQVLSVNAAIMTAIANGIVVCMAAGNRNAGLDDAGNPIQDTGSILVGPTAYHATENRRAWFSNFGSRITVAAPGDISHDLTCANTSNTFYMYGFGGTLGATPKVVATAALMLAIDPSLMHQEIRTILRDKGAETLRPCGITWDGRTLAAAFDARPSALQSGHQLLGLSGLYGPVAQLGERRPRMAEVRGSSPLGSTLKM
jgi:subtilisin family serine protease